MIVVVAAYFAPSACVVIHLEHDLFLKHAAILVVFVVLVESDLAHSAGRNVGVGLSSAH